MKKLISLILSIMMLATFVPMIASAAEPLAAPTSLTLANEVVHWPAVSGAAKYEVKVYSSADQLLSTNYSKRNGFYLHDFIDEAGDYSITVATVAEDGTVGTATDKLSVTVAATYENLGISEDAKVWMYYNTTTQTETPFSTDNLTFDSSTGAFVPKENTGIEYAEITETLNLETGGSWIGAKKDGYYIIDLGQKASLDKFVLVASASNAQIINYGTIQYSVDGVTWETTASTRSNVRLGSSSNYLHILTPSNAVEARYIVSEKTNYSTYGGGIYGMGFYGSWVEDEVQEPEVVIDVPTNVALTDEILTWNAIEDTTATYLVNVYNNDGSLNQQIDTVYTSENSSTHVFYSSCYIGDYINAAGTYKITVQAKVGDDVSAPTEEITVELDGNQNLSLAATSQTLYNTTEGTSSTFNNNMSTHQLKANIYGHLQIDLAQASMIENFTLVVNSQSEEYVNYGSVKFSVDGTTWFKTRCSIAKVRVGGYYNHILTPQAPIYAKYVRFEKTSDKAVNFRKAMIDGKAAEASTAATALENFLKAAPVASDTSKASYNTYDLSVGFAQGYTVSLTGFEVDGVSPVVSGTSVKIPAKVLSSADDTSVKVSCLQITVTNTADGSTASGIFSIDRKNLAYGYTFPEIAVTSLAVEKTSAGKIKATVTVTNDNIEEAGSAVVLIAVYTKNGELLTMETVSPATTISDFAPMEAVDTREVEIDAPTEEGNYVAKAFVFKNMSTIVPLAAAGVTEFTVQ